MLKRVSFGFLIFYIIFLANLPATLGVQWRLEFFERVNCTGRSENLTTSEDDLNTQWATNASSVRIIGMWRLSLHKFVGYGNWRVRTILFENAQPEMEQCSNKEDLINEPDFRDFLFERAELISDGGNWSLILLTEPKFVGLKYRANSSVLNGTLIPRPTKIESIVLLEPIPWLIYPETNFQGAPQCIHPQHKSNDGYTIIKPGTEIERIGSVRPLGNKECPSGSLMNAISFGLIHLCVCLSFLFNN